jgi:hypothetical protein
MDELIKDIPLFTALLFFIVALRMILQSEQFEVPVFNYLNVSNLLTASFDVIRGLLYYAVPVIVFLMWKKPITAMIDGGPWWLFVGLLIICAIASGIGYYSKKMTRWRNLVVKGLFELILLLIGVLLHNFCGVGDFQIVKLALGVVFLYGYMKINGKHEKFVNARVATEREVKIIFKDDPDEKRPLIVDGVFTNTMEFAFVQNAKNKEFLVLPMSEIRSIHYKKK